MTDLSITKEAIHKLSELGKRCIDEYAKKYKLKSSVIKENKFIIAENFKYYFIYNMELMFEIEIVYSTSYRFNENAFFNDRLTEHHCTYLKVIKYY